MRADEKQGGKGSGITDVTATGARSWYIPVRPTGAGDLLREERLVPLTVTFSHLVYKGATTSCDRKVLEMKTI